MGVMKNNKIKINRHERSFTLIETVIALGLMATVILEVSNVQGRAIYFSGYERTSSQAMWLAKSVMSKIEYEWQDRDFKDMEYKQPEKPFEDNRDFTYKVEIKEWELPLMNLITGGDEEGGEEDPKTDMIRQQIEKILGEDIMKTAHVEVFWPEGSDRNSVALSMLLTNQKKLSEVISTLKPITPPKPVRKQTGKKKGPFKGSSGG